MNLFVVDTDPVVAAQMLCNSHIIKQPLETAQMLCAAHHPCDSPYGRTHVTHPATMWVTATAGNYEWALAHGQALCDEYRRRYGKVHGSEEVIRWCDLARGPTEGGLQPFVQCMPDVYRRSDAVEAYRTYYREAKWPIAEWFDAPPYWWGSPYPAWWPHSACPSSVFTHKKNGPGWDVWDSVRREVVTYVEKAGRQWLCQGEKFATRRDAALAVFQRSSSHGKR